VTARQLNATDWEACQDIATWCRGTLLNLEDYLAQDGKNLLLILPTPTSTGSTAGDGDWIVASPGHFHVVPQAVFELLYETVGQG
jgi:hypothetical protein